MAGDVWWGQRTWKWWTFETKEDKKRGNERCTARVAQSRLPRNGLVFWESRINFLQLRKS